MRKKVQAVQRHFGGINDVIDDVCIWCPSKRECLSVAGSSEATAQSCPRGDLVLGVEEACHCIEHSSSCEACLSEPHCIFVPDSDANGTKLRAAKLQLGHQMQRDIATLSHPPACVREDECHNGHGGPGCKSAIVRSNTVMVSNATTVVRYIEYFDGRLRLPVQPSCSEILSIDVTVQDPNQVGYAISGLMFAFVVFGAYALFFCRLILRPICGPCLGELCGVAEGGETAGTAHAPWHVRESREYARRAREMI